jgi:hypothetical protein
MDAANVGKGENAMTKMLRPLAMLAACSALALPHVAVAQTTAVTPAITTPDKVDSRLEVLEFKDGSPAAGMNGAAEKLIAGENRV